MTQAEWDNLKKQNGYNDAQLHKFLLRYVETVHISLTPNQARLLRKVLIEYNPDYDEAAMVDKIANKLKA